MESFLKEESESKYMMVGLLKATKCIDIKYVHCINAGKNDAFEWLYKQEGMGIKCAYITHVKP